MKCVTFGGSVVLYGECVYLMRIGCECEEWIVLLGYGEVCEMLRN